MNLWRNKLCLVVGIYNQYILWSTDDCQLLSVEILPSVEEFITILLVTVIPVGTG